MKFYEIFFRYMEFGGSEKAVNEFSAIFVHVKKNRSIATYGMKLDAYIVEFFFLFILLLTE